ncbi:BLUF domain-containing protein [Muriicola sp.]|uniref:BLUF domain-containing protein n=1 Tax=Muriicola sp. TaxID=2020856 RepID=UPI003C722701
MFSLVYRSIARPGFDLDQIQGMLSKAKTFNHQQNITGCLLFYEGEFIQYLEGNQFKVLTLFDKIKEDKRHEKVELLSHGEIEKRAFETWDMAFENFYGENEQISHLKLVVSNYLLHKELHTTLHPSKAIFWETIGAVLYAKSST